MSLRRKAVSLAGCLIMAGGVLAYAAPTAGAASNPYTASKVCGSGYKTIDGPHSMNGKGTITLMYNSSNQNNCVAVIKTSYVGTATWTQALITNNVEAPPKHDDGSYKYYAKITIHAPHDCIQYGGDIYNGKTYKSDLVGSYGSGWGWCG